MSNQQRNNRVVVDVEALHYNEHGMLVPGITFGRVAAPAKRSQPATPAVTTVFFPSPLAMYQKMARLA